jgi:SEC-C motif-containing protein
MSQPAKPAPAATPCPCGQTSPSKKPLAYADCCGRFIEAFDTPAPDAQSLMRSRYSAFALERADYLRFTWDTSTCLPDFTIQPGAKWLGLEVRATRSTGADSAEVEFVARYRMDGRAVRVHERSRFVRIGGRWFYLYGDAL